MKRIITLLSTMLLATTIIFAQQQLVSVPSNLHRTLIKGLAPPMSSHMGKLSKSNSRSVNAVDTLQLDYSYYDQTIATNKGLNFNGGQGQAVPGDVMTSFVDSLHDGYKTEIAGIFDSLVFVTTTGGTGYIPLAGSTIYVDSLSLLLQLNGPIGNMINDSIRFDYYAVAPSGSASIVKTVIFSDTSMLEQFFPNGPYIPFISMAVGLQLPQGNGFAIGITYLNKDTSSTLDYFFSYADSCGVPSVIINGETYQINTAYPSSLGAITDYSIILGQGTGGSGPFEAEATNNLGFGFFSLEGAPNYLPANCALEVIQNLLMYPTIYVTTNYTVNISADNPKACPNGTVNLTSNVFGTNSPDDDISYNWSIEGNGQLTGNATSTNAIVMGASGNVTVTLSTTDAGNGNAVTSDSIVIVNAGPNVSITNGLNFNIPCGTSTVLVANVTGTPVSQQGRTYMWSDASTGVSLTVNGQNQNRPYNYAGDYSITVTNEWTCSATAAAHVTYNNGATNSLSFRSITTPLYANCETIYLNTSLKYGTPWTAILDPDNTGANLINVSNGTDTFPAYIYPAQGNYKVTLIMDSAGCRFAEAQNEQVIKLANGQHCTLGVEDLTFENNISLIPNPSNGNVNLVVNGIEKNISIVVYNIVGAQVRSFSASDVGSSYNRTFDFSDLASGAYLIRVQSGDKTGVKQMIISK